MDALAEFYRGKTVLITGHTGFKGSWLALWLNKMGAKVIGYALNPINEHDNFVLSEIGDRIVDIRGDIRDSEKLNSVFRACRPEIVFHLAAQPLVKYSYEQPKYTYEVNIMGTLNVLEAIRNTEETKIGIIITSDKCYENKEWIWGYRENDIMGGHDMYSSSKGCCELLVASYRNSFFNLNNSSTNKYIATVRAGNVIGGGDWSADRIIPDCITSLEKGKPILIRNPHAVRPWQHVLEPLGGYLLLGSKLLQEGIKYSGAWNFGPGPNSIISVMEIAELVIKHWGAGTWQRKGTSDVDMVHEARLLSLDISKSNTLLKWYPRWNADTAIIKTIEWYKNYKNLRIYDLCIRQINEYCSK